MVGTEIHVHGNEAIPSKKLRCPICGHAAVTFNSRTTVALRGVVEWLAIFACPESHVFFVPMTLACSLRLNLEQAQSLSLSEMQMMVRDRIERARTTVLSATAAVDASRRLLQCIRRTRDKWYSRQEEEQWAFSPSGPKTNRRETIH